MNQPRGLPPYPPDHNAWQYPPPPVSRRWVWAPIAAAVLSVLAAGTLGATAYIISTKDFPSLIQDERVVSVIARECDIMASTVDSMPVQGDTDEQADILFDQNRAVANMLKAIRAVDGDIRRADRPTNDWLDDWDKLIQAREAYANQILDGYEQDLRIPRDSSGDRIYLRMDEVWFDNPPVCEVPEALLNPYPADLSDV